MFFAHPACSRAAPGQRFRAMSDLDAIIIGAGHNGLTCAAYLGMAGLQRARVRAPRRGRRRLRHGGIPSRLSQLDRGLHGEPAAAESHSRPEARRARTAHRRAPRAEFSAAAGRALSAHRRRPHRSGNREIFRARRGALSAPMQAEIGRVADVLRSLILAAPPNLRIGGCARHARASSAPSARSAASCGAATRSARRCACFANRPAPCSMAGSSPIRSRRCSASTPSSAIWRVPTAPGSAYVLLHHVFGEVNGKRGVWGHAIGRHGRDHPSDGARRGRRTACASIPAQRCAKS